MRVCVCESAEEAEASACLVVWRPGAAATWSAIRAPEQPRPGAAACRDSERGHGSACQTDSDAAGPVARVQPAHMCAKRNPRAYRGYLVAQGRGTVTRQSFVFVSPSPRA